MKSIEEKARRYDKAIERAKALYKAAEPMSGCNVIIEILFPEFVESEDERIRKELLNYLYDVHDDDKERARWIVWLEKQANHANFRNRIQIGDKVTRNEDGVLVNLSQLNRVAKKNEQKPADKVEPKFKVGDWITNGIDFTFQIHSIEDNMYLRSDDYFIDIETADKKFRLWTIQDAKDGDVLVCESGWTCIFKALDNHTNTFSSYCFMDSDKWFCNTGSECHTLDKAFIKAYHDGEIHPATKEQRDLLFKKMKEAGYEWDTEKKELKKIEQKSDKWEPQTGDTFRKKGTTSPTYHLCNKREDGITFGFVENREVGIAGGEITIFSLREDYELVERPKSIEDVVEEELNRALQTKGEQEPAEWSEEDEVLFRTAKKVIFESDDCSDGTANKVIDWLKSLKDRVQPQKQEWSEEDEETMSKLLSLLLINHPDVWKTFGDWLKSLKERYAWKPSEEQISLLQAIVNEPNNAASESCQITLKEVIRQLKKLKKG